MSLPQIARVGVAAGWHCSPSKNAPAVAHLMPTSWAADGRKSRPALCGERRQRWINHLATDKPTRYDPCGTHIDDQVLDEVLPPAHDDRHRPLAYSTG